jgi:hypothetical protein
LYFTDGGLGTLSPEDKLIWPRLNESFMKDGASNTLLFATKYQTCGIKGGSRWLDPGGNATTSPTAATFGVSMNRWQIAPSVNDCDSLAGTAVSLSKDGMLVDMCDGSVRKVSVDVSPATWQALQTPNAGDTVGDDWN